MTPKRSQSKPKHPGQSPTHAEFTAKQLEDLDIPDNQEEYRGAYLEQLRRQSCPGCGDHRIA